MSKYSGIIYPLCGTKYMPRDIIYTSDNKIFIIDKEYNRKLLDDLTLSSKTYLGRLLQLDQKNIERVNFNYTANILENIIFSKIRWGIDNSGKIFNLSKRELVPFRSTKVEKIKDKLIWVKGVSYPFHIPIDIKEVINKHLFVEVVYINNKWRLYNFTYKYDKAKNKRV